MRSFVIVQSRWQLQQMSGSSTTRCVLRASSPAAPPLSTHQPEPCNINTPTHPGECTEQKLNISWRMCQKRKGTHTHTRASNVWLVITTRQKRTKYNVQNEARKTKKSKSWLKLLFFLNLNYKITVCGVSVLNGIFQWKLLYYIKRDSWAERQSCWEKTIINWPWKPLFAESED